jgi:sugar/nucleoside kinase (ribokinase family)
MSQAAERSIDVLVAGELNVDVIVTGDVTPSFGQVEKLVDGLAVCAGGSASIFAAAAARMGLRVKYGSVVGDDLFGRYMMTEMGAAGVDVSGVRVDAAVQTGATLILSRGIDRAMLTYLGSMAAVGPDALDPAWFAQARHLHVASPFILTGLRAHMPGLMRAAKAAGMTVSLDTNWDPEERWDVGDLLAQVDVFLPNEREAMAIAGTADLAAAVETLAARVPLLVIKLGAEGALAVRGGERVRVPAYVVPTVDTTGAGDTFDGGFLAGWLRGEPLRRCLELGAACGALTTTRPGGLNGQPTWEQALALIAPAG